VTNTTLMRCFAAFCISVSRCSVVGLKPIVTDWRSGGGSVRVGFSVLRPAFPRFLFLEFEVWEADICDARGARRLS